MKKVFWPFLILLFCFTVSGYAQNSREASKSETSRSATYAAGQKKIHRKHKKTKYSYAGVYDKKIQEFEARMKAVVKEKEKAEREMKKPQYSDPGYFGHKRKPKKRPPGKKKYCKQCGLYH